MSAYRFRITVEGIEDGGEVPVHGRTLTFETMQPEDILATVERMRTRLPLDGVTVASLAIGLHLFSEVALLHRSDPLFAEIQPALKAFIGGLKQTASY